MFDFIKKKLEKNKLKKEFKEYGYTINKFNTSRNGAVEYAQWLHPFEGPKDITDSKINFYKKFAKEGDIIIDVGAHTGDTTVPMALAVGAKGLVLALEPNPYVFKILEANSKLNQNQTNIVPLCFAATETQGEFVFNYSDASFCNGGFLTKIQNQNHNHNYSLTVKGGNLEDYLRSNYAEEMNKIALIKVDAEGFDKYILQSISKTIAEFKPYLLLECYKKLTPQERSELFKVVAEKDYELFYLEEHEEDSKITKINSQDDMTKWNHFEILAIPNSKKGEVKF